MMNPRRKSKPVQVGDVQVGGDAPVAVQSMCSHPVFSATTYACVSAGALAASAGEA